MSEYSERIKEYIGPPTNGRKDYFDLSREESIKLIKEALKTNFAVNLWTFEMPKEQIDSIHEELDAENIVHYWDATINSFICFRTVEDMKGFYEGLKKELSNEKR